MPKWTDQQLKQYQAKRLTKKEKKQDELIKFAKQEQKRIEKEKINKLSFKEQNQIRTAQKVEANSTNALTKQIILFLKQEGFMVWRNNTVGIFDVKVAAKKLLSFFYVLSKGQRKPTIKDFISILSNCYRKSHDRVGVSDIIGFHKKDGTFIAVEVKFGKDKMSIEQELFFQDLSKSKALGFVARSYGGFVKEFVLSRNGV